MNERVRQSEQWALRECRSHGLRLTRGLKDVIRVLANQNNPISLSQLSEHPDLGPHYDASTLYRVIFRIQEIGIVRRIGFHGRAAHFILRAPGMHSHFLVCRSCGDVRELNIDCPVHELDKQIEKSTGFKNLEHDLSFYGVCKKCR